MHSPRPFPDGGGPSDSTRSARSSVHPYRSYSRIRRTAPIISALVAPVLVAGLAGCGSSDEESAPSALPGTQIEVGSTINYQSTGSTATIDCAEGKSLTVGGANNTLTVTGTCASVNVGGADNKVTLEAVERDIASIGLNNTIVYSSGDPTINDTGQHNTIRKG